MNTIPRVDGLGRSVFSIKEKDCKRCSKPSIFISLLLILSILSLSCGGKNVMSMCFLFVFKTNAMIGLSTLDCMIEYIYGEQAANTRYWVCVCVGRWRQFISRLVVGFFSFAVYPGSSLSLEDSSQLQLSPGSSLLQVPTQPCSYSYSNSILILKLNTHTVLLNSLYSQFRFCYNLSFVILQS